jgi:hypothetical protein
MMDHTGMPTTKLYGILSELTPMEVQDGIGYPSIGGKEMAEQLTWI